MSGEIATILGEELKVKKERETWTSGDEAIGISNEMTLVRVYRGKPIFVNRRM